MTDHEKVVKILDDTIRKGGNVITEEDAKSILSLYGIKVPDYSIVTTDSEAVSKAKEIGFPLVAKIVSDQILHKTDVQGVKIGLQNENEVKETFLDMYNRLSKDYKIKGVLLEKMVPKGIELIVGLQNDPQFGPVIMLGLGGIYTELFKDVSFRVLPISKQDALDMINDLRAKEILQGFRGSQKINLDMLCDAIIKIGNLGFDLAKYINSVDFNPIIVYPDNYYVVDAKIILTSDTDKNIVSQSMPDSRYMDVFFNANSIALIGASPEEGKIGNSVLKSLSQYDYKGKIYPVNAKGYDKILGLKAYKNLEDINEKIDLVIVTVDLKFVPAILETCGKIGIHNMVIISGGGKELGGERAEIEQKVKELSSKLNIRIIGPNCIGMFNGENRLDCAFQGHDRMVRPRKGDVAFLSQSGTIGIAFMETSDAFGMSKMISYGNGSDVD
ncbi:MAG TPA: acetate--CoA ligase family protein, partial [Nitrososphaeraceae archaeon]|nr:acetate--CoA ligase family protein [Nitrososphaeraceae archaeon]